MLIDHATLPTLLTRVTKIECTQIVLELTSGTLGGNHSA